MFDEDKKISQAPSNLPFAPEPAASVPTGVVAAAEPPDALQAGFLKKKSEEHQTVSVGSGSGQFVPPSSAGPAMMPPLTYTTKEPVLGKILAGILTVAAVGMVGFGGWYGYQRFIKGSAQAVRPSDVSPSSEKTPAPSTSTEKEAANTVFRSPVTSTTVQAQTSNDTLLFGEQTDTDNDGLSDRREREIGTDPAQTDTDRDGLRDGDEVLVWNTNPLMPDSDGDGYKDGDEVLHGYNPLGSGKLFANPSSSTSTKNATNTSITTGTSSVTSSVQDSIPNIPSL